MNVVAKMFRSPGTLLWFLAPVGLALGGCSAEQASQLTGPDATLDPVLAQAPASQALAVKAAFNASLSGGDAGTDSKGAGEARFRFQDDDSMVDFRLNVANIENVTMAHIHLAAAPGGNGPPVVWLYPAGPPPVQIPGRTQGTLAMGTFTEADFVGPLAGMSIPYLREAMSQGRAYVNVHTSQFPGGEIRGTIR